MMNVYQIQQNIQTIKIQSASVKQLTQDTAVAILWRTKEHGDCSLAIPLIEALGKGARHNALKAWFESGGLSFYKDKNKKQRVSIKTRPLPSTINELSKICWTTFRHEDEPESNEKKAKRAFLNALKWLQEYPELARECGLAALELEQENQIAA